MTERKPIRVLGNARDLIDVLAEHGPLTPAEIAGLTGIPRPSVYRLAEGLKVIGLVSGTSDARIALSLRWLHLADTTFQGMVEWAEAPGILAEATARTELTAFLTVPRHEEAVCIAWSPGSGIGVLILKPGRVLPLYTGAAGRVMLAAVDDLDGYLARAPFPALTPSTLVDAEALRADVARTREQGYVLSDEDATVGIGALGVPVRGASGELVACVSLAGTADAVRSGQERMLEVLRAATARLEAGRAAVQQSGVTS